MHSPWYHNKEKNVTKSFVPLLYFILSFKAFFSFHSNVFLRHSLAESCGPGVAHGSFGSSREPLWTANPHSVFILVSPLPSNRAFSPSFFVKRPTPGITRDDDVPHAASRSTRPDSWFFSLRSPHKETKWNTCLARVGREGVNPGDSQTITHSRLIYITIELWKFRPFQKTLQIRCRRARFFFWRSETEPQQAFSDSSTL